MSRGSLLSEEAHLGVKLDIKLALDLGLDMLNNRVDLGGSGVIVVDHKASMLIGNASTTKTITLKTSVGNKLAYKVTLGAFKG